MSLTGLWENAYGSLMELTQESTGLITGVYTSTTGSSGTYTVYGCANVPEPTPAAGQSVALSISWRSILGGAGDPSWHWTSGLGGQLSISDAGVETLTLIHALVATVPFPGLTAAGTYLDKLTYTRVGGRMPSRNPVVPATAATSAMSDALTGLWVCTQNPQLTMNLVLASELTGSVIGEFATASGSSPGRGLTDAGAASAGLQYQSFTLSSALAGTGKTIALAGSIDYGTNLLQVTALENIGTPNDATYVTTNTQSWTFRKVLT